MPITSSRNEQYGQALHDGGSRGASNGIKLKVVEGNSAEDYAGRRLVEIKDGELIGAIDSVAAVAFHSSVSADAAEKAADAVRSMGEVATADVDFSKLDKSREVADALRGSVHEGGRYAKSANWKPVDTQQLGDEVSASFKDVQAINAAMGVASIVVGQYYMAQINSRIESIERGISTITSLLERKYKSEVLALVTAVKRASDFSYETLASDELRNRELIKLDSLEHKCAELIAQTNLAIMETKKNAFEGKLDYEKYEGTVKEIQEHLSYRRLLMGTMQQIAELTHALNLGARSRKNCYAECRQYAQQSEEVREALDRWHKCIADKLNLDFMHHRKEHRGLMKALTAPKNFLRDSLWYTYTNEETTRMANDQIYGPIGMNPIPEIELFEEEVVVLNNANGTFYVLPAGFEQDE